MDYKENLTTIDIACRSKENYMDIRTKNANEFCLMETIKEFKERNNYKYSTVVTELNVMQAYNFDHPTWTSIIQQMRENFVNFHENYAKNNKDKNLSNMCLEANQNYIKILETELKSLENTIADDEETGLNKDIKDTLERIIKLWKLCEIIFIKSSPSGALLIDLQKWYKSVFNLDPFVQRVFLNANLCQQQIYDDGDYWPTITYAILQGRIEIATHLLSFHNKHDTSVFRSMNELMRKMPKFDSLEYTPTFEFKAKWEFWQKECLNVLRTEDFTDSNELEDICNIFCGNESKFIEIKKVFPSWDFMLISWLLYSNPTFNISDLHLQLNKFVELFQDDFYPFDIIVYNVFEFNVKNVVNDSSEYFKNNIFSSHLLDILFLNGKLQLNNESKYADYNPIQLYEQHLADYATSLLGYKHLWTIGFDYLLECQQYINGIDIIVSYIETIPINNEAEANNLFNIAVKFGLQDQAYSIGRIIQMRLLRNGEYENSLNWCLKIKDPSFGTVLADKIMEEYLNTNNTKLLEIMDNRAEKIIFCDRLVFLSKYREYLKLIKLERYKDAANILVQLLEASQLIPTKFRENIILEVANVLSKYAFNGEQIFSLLRAIENYNNRMRTFNEPIFRLNENLLNKQTDLALLQLQNEKDAKLNNIYETLSTQLANVFVSNSIDLKK